MRENLSDLITFLNVVKEGSFTRAAALAGTSQSAVSQTVSNLEQRLQLKLLNRTTRSLTLTEAGEKLVTLVAPAIEDINIGLEQLGELRDTPSGTVRISADEYAIQQVLWPKLAPVIKQFPEINLELITDYGLVDIAKGGFDAGVRRGGLIAKDMIAMQISNEHKMSVVVSPDCSLQDTLPKVPSDLVSLPCINLKLPTHGDNFPWIFSVDEQEYRIRVKGQVVVNGINQVVQAALDGYGYAYVPEVLVAKLIDSGQLISVLPSYCITHSGYYLYYTSRLQSSAAFKVILDALKHSKP
ncbi:LysR family transcriptional regulator [Vibrio mimicus]